MVVFHPVLSANPICLPDLTMNLPGFCRKDPAQADDQIYSCHFDATLSQQVRLFCQQQQVPADMLFFSIHLAMLSRICNLSVSQSLCHLGSGAAQPLAWSQSDWPAGICWLNFIREVTRAGTTWVDAVEHPVASSGQHGQPLPVFVWEPLPGFVQQLCAAMQTPAYVVSVASPDSAAYVCEFRLFRGQLPQMQLQCYAETFQHLLAVVTANPHGLIAAEQFHPPRILQQLELGWQFHTASLDTMPSLPEILLMQANTRGSDIAFQCEQTQLTFAQCARQVFLLAGGLQAAGVMAGDRVAVYCERDLEWVVIQLACMITGAVYVPLDLRFPPARIAQMILHSAARLVVTAGDTADLTAVPGCEELDIRVVSYAALAAGPCADPKQLCQQFSPLQVAYIQFTSGTTGVPKGAMVEHLGMMNHLLAKMTELELSSKDVIAQTASQCFDVSIWQVLAGLYCGARTVIFREEMIWDLLSLMQMSADNAVTILEVVPSYLELLFDVHELSDQRYFSALRYLVVTGERLTVGQAARWFKYYPQIPLVNAYGPTEASDDITHFKINREFQAERIPIGYPIANAAIYILDESLALLPFGSVGEICVAGPCVGRGYINAPEATARAFVTALISGQPTRLYRTGDFGRWLPEGGLEYYGRRDEQVKVMGIRIELTEIEQQLSVLDWIKDVAVVCRDNRLLCYYTSDDNQVRSAQAIRADIDQMLPAHLIPARFHRLDKMPVNLNGKINKAQLC